MQQLDCSALPSGRLNQRRWQHPLCKHETRFVCKALAAADFRDFSLSNLEAQLSRTWPAWVQNACRRNPQVLSLELTLPCYYDLNNCPWLLQDRAGQVVEGPTPCEAAGILTRLAKAVQNQGPDAYARQSLVGLIHLQPEGLRHPGCILNPVLSHQHCMTHLAEKK